MDDDVQPQASDQCSADSRSGDPEPLSSKSADSKSGDPMAADPKAADPRARFGSAKHPERPVEHVRPSGMDDATVEALGKVSEALEVVEQARGMLYGFHRHCGRADLALQDGVRQLREAGHGDIADELEEVLVGRDIIAGRWSFQVIEDYDENYWQVFRAMEASARERLSGAEPHIFEAEMKVTEQAGPASDT